MGIQLTSKYSSTCPECDRNIKVGDKIYYDGDNRNSYGKKIVCTDITCFREQGGVLDEDGSSEFRFILPKNIEYDPMTFGLVEDLFNTIVIKAHERTKRQMPNLDEDSSAFGQIRNANMDKYIKLYIYKKEQIKKL